MMPRWRGRVMSRYVSEGCPNGVDNRSGRIGFRFPYFSWSSISEIEGILILYRCVWYVWLNVYGTLLYASLLKQQNTLISPPRFHTPTMNPTAGIASRSHKYHQPKTNHHKHPSQRTPLHHQLLDTSFATMTHHNYIRIVEIVDFIGFY